jgi:hypothetical protein
MNRERPNSRSVQQPRRFPTRRFALALFALLLVAFTTLAQQSSAPPPPKPAASVVDAAQKSESKQDESIPPKIFTNDDLSSLPRRDISVAGSPSTSAADANSQTAAAPGKSQDDDSAKAAYWKARFMAARQKLAQDEKALPALQSQLEVERVQECSVDEDTGQVYSDTFMDLLNQINTMKQTVEHDKQILSDLHDEFRHAGGQPGWIR